MSQEINPTHDHDSDSSESNFQAPPQTTISELLNKDAEDEALNRYKQALLGSAANQAGINEESSLEFVKMSVYVTGENEPIIYTLINSGLVNGLCYSHNVTKAGVTVDKQKIMVGSFAASDKICVFKTTEEIAPSGMLGRGHYKVTSNFYDDDQNLYLKFEWDLTVCKAAKS